MPTGIYIRTKETRRKLSEAERGEKNHNYGKRLTEEHRRKISETNKGHKVSLETRRKISEANKGKKHSPSKETRKKMSEAKKGKTGEMAGGWKGGVTPESIRIRNSIEIRLWREAVFARDGWACQRCGTRSGLGKTIILNSHHIRNFAEVIELRTSIENGITFCKECHIEFHKRYGKRNNTREQVEEFIKTDNIPSTTEEFRFLRGIY